MPDNRKPMKTVLNINFKDNPNKAGSCQNSTFQGPKAQSADSGDR